MMKKKFTNLWAIAALLIITGCVTEPPAVQQQIDLINVTEILEREITYYLQHPPKKIEKRMVYNGLEESTEEDTSGLANMRQMMEGYNVTGASFVNSFNEEVQQVGPNIYKKTLQARPDANIAIRTVQLIYRQIDTLQQPVFLLVTKQEENLLYNTRQVMALYFTSGRLTRLYALENQKIVLMQPSRLELTYSFYK